MCVSMFFCMGYLELGWVGTGIITLFSEHNLSFGNVVTKGRTQPRSQALFSCGARLGSTATVTEKNIVYSVSRCLLEISISLGIQIKKPIDDIDCSLHLSNINTMFFYEF